MPEHQGPMVDALRQDGGGPLLGPLIKQALRWYQDSVQARLDVQGEPRLSLTQFEIFGWVDWDGTTIAELARRMGIARQSAHQAVGELVRAGLLSVGPDPTSGRSKLVRPTAHAIARLRVVREVLVEVEQQLVERLGCERVEQLRAILGSDWGTPTPDSSRPVDRG